MIATVRRGDLADRSDVPQEEAVSPYRGSALQSFWLTLVLYRQIQPRPGRDLPLPVQVQRRLSRLLHCRASLAPPAHFCLLLLLPREQARNLWRAQAKVALPRQQRNERDGRIQSHCVHGPARGRRVRHLDAKHVSPLRRHSAPTSS